MPVLTSFSAEKRIELDHEAPGNSSYFTAPSGVNSEFDPNYSKILIQPSILTSQQVETPIPHNHSNLGCYPSHASPSVTGSSSPVQRTTAVLKYEVPTSISIRGASVNVHGPNEFKPPQKLPEVKCVVRARIPTTIGGTGTEMFLHLYQNSEDNKEHLAIVFGNTIRSRSLDGVRDGETEMDRLIRGAYVGRLYPGRTSSDLPGEMPILNEEKDAAPPLVRIHSECYTGETVWSARCDCGEQLDEAARLMSTPTPSNSQASGVIIYLRQEGRGIGLGEKLKAYNLQDLGSDTVEANLLLRHPADARSYGLATAMLMDLGINQVRLLTNNPDKIRAIEGPNREIVVTERVAMVPLAWKKGELGGIRSEEVGGYLQTKVSPSLGQKDNTSTNRIR